MIFKDLFKYHINELIALVVFLAGSALSMLGLIQVVPLAVGIVLRADRQAIKTATKLSMKP